MAFNKTLLLIFLTLGLMACGPDYPMDTKDVEEDSMQGDSLDPHTRIDDAETVSALGGVLLVNAPVLPEQLLDYVAYADTSLPRHFVNIRRGPDTVLLQDNTPVNNPITNTGATLGRVLFYDLSLSVNDTKSCASCHQQAVGFSDPDVLSTGFQGGLTGRHSMSLSNNRFYLPGNFFWDHRADTLEDQVLMPIQDSVEMGMTLDDLVVKLAELPYYDGLFIDAFGDSTITSQRIALALAQFTRAMVSYQSKYDLAFALARREQGVDFSRVLTADENAGRLLFEQTPQQGGVGCAGCHRGVAQIADEAHNIGLDLTAIDEGAGEGRFKVPSLRNIAVSAPYMHDGRFATLAEVIEHYNSGIQDHPNLDPALRTSNNGQPVRFNMTELEKRQLEAFLHTLTDNLFLTSELFSNPFPVIEGD